MLHTITKQKASPPIILIYGPPKIGKSSFGALAENPVFIQTEDGIGNIDVNGFPLAKSFREVLDALGALATQEHDYKTVVVDSVDWLEPLIHKQVCAENGVSSIEKIGYGRGYTMALDLWRQYIDCLKYLRDAKQMTVVQIAHSEIKRFDSPDTDSYDRYQIKLHRVASDLIMESSDAILFVNYFVGITKSETGFKKEKTRAIGSGERVLYTEERPSFKAGNRYGLPEQIPFTKDGAYWGALAQFIPFYQQKSKEVS